MATTNVPQPYQGLVPNIDKGELSPIQLALASILASGFPLTEAPILVNEEFVRQMQRFTDSGLVTPILYDYQSATSALYRGTITGYSYILDNGKIYMLRKAQDCGPDENRTELVELGPRTLAEGTFAYYGSAIIGGSFATGGGGPWGTGGVNSPYPRNDDSPGNPYSGVDVVALSSYGTDPANSFLGSPVDPQLIGNYAGRGGIA